MSAPPLYLRLFLLPLVSRALSLSLFASVVSAEERPNILLIVADDLGFSDLGCYGGEIDTPHLDQLAKEGVRFSEFHVNPMCTVTRTSLLTGHTHSQSDRYRNSLPLPEALAGAGYSTSLSGKWHQPGNPLEAGFHSFYGFLQGQINSWTGGGIRKPTIQRDRGQPEAVAEGWYSSDAFTDEAILQMQRAKDEGKPFFSLLAYNAPHSPLQAPRANVEKYYQRYRVGWDKLRQERYRNLLAEGLIDERYVMSPPQGEVRRWDEMPAAEQELESRRFAAYAGMVDRLDENVGRLLAFLRKEKLIENTIIIFLSDNGGDYGNGNITTAAQQVPWEAESLPFAASGWAHLRCTPFRWYKSSAQEGGVSVPLIVRAPERMATKPGGILKQRLHVTDLYATCLDLAAVEYPEELAGRKLKPLYGHSMLPLWQDPTLDHLAIHNEIFWAFNTTGKGLLRDEWKLTSLSDGPWMLFNIISDPAEAVNLAEARPEVVARMSARWFHFAENETAMPRSWRMPLADYQEGFGFHRIAMATPFYQRASPASSAVEVPLDTDLSFYFTRPVSFARTKGKKIRLWAVGQSEAPVWENDPEPNDAGEGSLSITFTDIPRLTAETTYYVTTDAGWIRIGGKPAKSLNDGAFWYRFRTK